MESYVCIIHSPEMKRYTCRLSEDPNEAIRKAQESTEDPGVFLVVAFKFTDPGRAAHSEMTIFRTMKRLQKGRRWTEWFKLSTTTLKQIINDAGEMLLRHETNT